MSRISRASKAYEDFSGHKPSKVRRSRLPDQDVTGWEMGPVIGVAYEARRDGETKPYFHEFKKNVRPRLVARDDGRQLYIEGGKYKVTERGIEDMPYLMTVNPSPRKGRAAPKRRAKPMARRRRATRARRRTSQVAVFRANPVRRRRRRAHVGRRRAIFARNPVRRVRRRRARVAMRRNPIRRRRSMRRNPTSGGAINFGRMLLPAMGIGAGAVGSEIIMGYLPIPATWKTGPMRHITKGAVGVGAGYLIGKVLKQKRLGNFFMLGAVAIATHDWLKEMIASRWSSIPGLSGGMGYLNPGSVARFNGMGYNRAVPSAVAAGLGYAPMVRSAVAVPMGNAATIIDRGGYLGETDFNA